MERRAGPERTVAAAAAAAAARVVQLGAQLVVQLHEPGALALQPLRLRAEAHGLVAPSLDLAEGRRQPASLHLEPARVPRGGALLGDAPQPGDGDAAVPELLGRPYLSSATCLMRPLLFYACFVVSGITIICHMIHTF